MHSVYRMEKRKFIRVSLDSLQRRAHKTWDVALNSRSTAVDLGSVALLLRMSQGQLDKLAESDLEVKYPDCYMITQNRIF